MDESSSTEEEEAPQLRQSTCLLGKYHYQIPYVQGLKEMNLCGLHSIQQAL
jgi:hypothetical protein